MHIDHNEYTILLADDSISNLEKMKGLLLEERFKLACTLNLEEVFLLAKSKAPDMIVIRVASGARKGEILIQQLKQCALTKFIPILYMTTSGCSDDLKTITNYEGVEFVARPLSKRELILRINNQLLLVESQRIIERQNERIQDELRAKNKLYSVIAHDLRAPIGTLKMILETIELQKEQISDTNIVHLIKMLQETTDEAYLLLENLLQWSSNQNGVLQPCKQKFSFTETVEEVVDAQKNIAEAKRIKICNHVDHPFVAYADVNMIKTVLRNLLSNAIKFSYPEGKIDVNCKENNGQLTISVRDYGQGISEEHQKKLMKGMSRFVSAETQKESGSGLGLQLCQDFVKLNHGELWFKSKEGAGTTFCFSVPES